MSDYNNGNQGQWTQGPGGQNQYPGGPGAPDPMRQDQPRPRNGYATVSMICGIFGILCLCCFAFPLAIILGVGAVCFAIISKRGQPFYATAIFGIVLGVIAVVLGIGEFVYFMALSSLVKDPANAALINEFMEQLEQQMEEKFYHPDIHVYTSEEDEEKNTGEEEQDSRLMEKISEDISRKDVKQLWSHFRSLASKYQSNTQFSAMYVKFVFSNVIQELFQENQFSEERKLDHEVERLYSCTNLEVDHLYGCSTIQEIIEVTEKNIRQYEEFLDRSMSESRDEVAAVKNYIYNHYAEDLNLETLAEKVYLSSGYLSFIFKKETGMNLNRFIRVFRMEKAKELLRTTNMKVAMVSEQVGFANSSYFCRSFREYYGSSPESYRKGNNEDEESSEEV